jgi:hypothetical protein
MIKHSEEFKQEADRINSTGGLVLVWQIRTYVRRDLIAAQSTISAIMRVEFNLSGMRHPAADQRSPL